MTLLIKLKNINNKKVLYEPGDHLGVFACNQEFLVHGILEKLETTYPVDDPVQIQIQKEIHSPNGNLH